MFVSRKKVADLEKNICELEADVRNNHEQTVQALEVISQRISIELDKVINEYKNAYLQASLDLINKIKNSN